MRLLDNPPGERVTQRLPQPPYPARRWLAAAVWLAMVGAAIILNWQQGWPPLEIAAFFGVIYALSVIFSVRLPGGAYVGLDNTAVAAAVLVLGPVHAMLIAPLVALPLGLGQFAATRWLKRLGRFRSSLVVERMWHSSSLAMAALLAGWLYGRLGGALYPVLLQAMDFGLVVGFIAVFFLIRTAMLLVWLRLSRVRIRQYYREYGWPLISGSLLATLIFAPLLAGRFAIPEGLTWLLLFPFVAGLLLLYNINAIQLSLIDRIDDLRALNSVSQRLATNLDFDAVLQALRDEISRLMDASGLYIAIYDPDTNQLDFPIIYEDGEAREPASRAFANGLTEYVIRTGQPLLLPRLHQQAPALGIEPGGQRLSRTFLGVPLSAGDEVIGVLGLRHYSQEYAYDDNDRRLLETIASGATVALRNARLFSRSRRQAIELTALNRVSGLVSASPDLDTVLQAVCAEVCAVMHADKSAAFLLNEDKTVNLAGGQGISERFRQRSMGIPYYSSRALAARRGEPVIIEDTATDIRVDDVREIIEDEGIRAAIEVPMHSSDSIIGTLVIYYTEPRRFDTNEVELMGTLAGQVAVAVENTRLFEAILNQRRELETLYETGRQVNASLNVSNVLKAVANGMLEAVEGDTCVALLTSEDGEKLRLEQSFRLMDGQLYVQRNNAAAVSLEDLPDVRQAASERLPAIVLEHVTAPNLLHVLEQQHGLKNGLALPMVIHQELVGLILVGSQHRALNYSQETQQMAAALADQAAVAVQNARLFERTDVALAHRLEQLATLENLAQRMTRRLDLQTVIEQLVSAAANSTGAEAAELLLLDENSRVLSQVAAVGLTPYEAASMWPADMGLAGQALQSGQPVLANNVGEFPEYVEVRKGVLSELAVPVLLDNRRLGVINLESTQADAFDQGQVSFVTSLAEHAAIAIQNAQLFESVQRRADEFQTLRAVAVDLLSSSDVKHTLRVIARMALDQTAARDIHIYLYNNQTGQITFGTSLWRDGEVDREFSEPRPDGITATVARSGERLVVRDPRNHPIFANVVDKPGWQDLGGIVSMPLLKRSQVIGVFNIAYDDPARITEDSLHFLDLLATQAAVAIDNSLLVEETRQHRNTLQAILDSIHDGILMFDVNGILQIVNPRVGEMLDLSVDRFLYQHFVTVMHGVFETNLDREAFSRQEVIRLARQIQADQYGSTVRSYTLDTPEFRAIEEQSIAVVGQHGELLGRLFVLRDVTREHEIAAYREEVSHMIVHDLRAPLAGIITGLTMAVDETNFLATSDHKDTLAASLRVALTSGNQLLRLVEEILEVNKLEAGEMPLALEPVDLGQVAERIKQLLGGTAADADITIEIEAESPLPPIRADADKIERVFINLLDNALRYTPDGGIIRVRIEQQPGVQTVTVSDSGEGIAPQDRDRIFERFFQGDLKRRKRGAKGSGLGLTFCRLAVEAHGGEIAVGEGPDGGAAFTFTLPVADSTAEPWSPR